MPAISRSRWSASTDAAERHECVRAPRCFRPVRIAALGRLGRCNSRRSCRTGRDRHELDPAAARPRRQAAGDHDRPGAGFGRAAIDAAGTCAGRVDGAGRRLAARAGQAAGSGGRADRADPAAGAAGSGGAARAEGGNEAGPRAGQAGARSQADAGQTENRASRSQEAERGATGAAHRRAAARRTPGPGRLFGERRRSRLGGRILWSARPRPPDALPPVPGWRPAPVL